MLTCILLSPHKLWLAIVQKSDCVPYFQNICRLYSYTLIMLSFLKLIFSVEWWDDLWTMNWKGYNNMAVVLSWYFPGICLVWLKNLRPGLRFELMTFQIGSRSATYSVTTFYTRGEVFRPMCSNTFVKFPCFIMKDLSYHRLCARVY